jgi:hydrogenase expression/formation protein HypC
MCLAIPGKITAIENHEDETFRTGKVSFGGILKEVNLALVPEARTGDYVLVHVGIAISIVDEYEALRTLQYIEQLDDLEELKSSDDAAQ